MWRALSARSNARQHLFDFDDVVALSGDKIVGPSDAALNKEDRRLVGCREARVDGLRQTRIDANRSQKRGLSGHVRSGDQHASARFEYDAVRNGVRKKRVPQIGEHTGSSLGEMRPSP